MRNLVDSIIAHIPSVAAQLLPIGGVLALLGTALIAVMALWRRWTNRPARRSEEDDPVLHAAGVRGSVTANSALLKRLEQSLDESRRNLRAAIAHEYGVLFTTSVMREPWKRNRAKSSSVRKPGDGQRFRESHVDHLSPERRRDIATTCASRAEHAACA
jgi:hypothetical protein